MCAAWQLTPHMSHGPQARGGYAANPRGSQQQRLDAQEEEEEEEHVEESEEDEVGCPPSLACLLAPLLLE